MVEPQKNIHSLAIGGLNYVGVSLVWVLIACFLNGISVLLFSLAVMLIFFLVISAGWTLKGALDVRPFSAEPSDQVNGLA